jgi:hypothetical protein
LRTEVAFLQGKELYASTGAGGFEEKDFSELAANAAIAPGSFALYSTNLFRGKAAMFTYTGESRVNGRSVARYEFRVPLERSRFEVRVGTRIAVVAYAGHFLADLLTGDVVRLEVHGEDLPPELSLSQLSHVFEYRRVRIGDAEPLLTRRAEMSTLGVSRDAFKRPHAVQFKNVTELDSCRRFTAESSIFATDSTITFEDKRRK